MHHNKFSGHNGGASFDEVVEQNLLVGIYLAQRDAMGRALRDKELSDRHRVILAELVFSMNDKTGMAFPGRKRLAEATGYPESTVGTTIYELVKWGYIKSARRAPENTHRALTHYTVVRPTLEELQATITEHIEALRQRRSVKPSSHRWQPTFNPVMDVNKWPEVNPVEYLSPKINPVVDVKLPQARPVDVNPVVHTVIDSFLDSRQDSLESKNNIIPPTRILPTEENRPQVVAAVSVASKAKREKNRARIAADWMPTPELVSWVNQNFIAKPAQIEREAQKFRDHHLSKGSLMVDWAAAWRTWWGNEFHKIPRRTMAPAPLFDCQPKQTDDGSVWDEFRQAREFDIAGGG